MDRREAIAALNEARHHLNEAMRLAMGVQIHFGLPQAEYDLLALNRPNVRRWECDLSEISQRLQDAGD